MNKEATFYWGMLCGISLVFTAMAAAAITTPGPLFADSTMVFISNSTAYDLCFNLTNNTAVVATAEDGKLICELPSYDHVQSIIIRDNSEGGR